MDQWKCKIDSPNQKQNGPAPQPPRRHKNLVTPFAKGVKMPSAKFQVSGRRQTTSVAIEEGYLGIPPSDRNLVKARLVIPGKHMLPDSLDKPDALNDIRKSHKVWIVAIQANIFEISSISIIQIQRAIDSLNETIHDLRLSNEHMHTRYLLQKPSRTVHDERIHVALNSRPRLIHMLDGPCDMSAAVQQCLQELGPNLLPSSEVLMSVNSELRMRASFGCLNIRSKKKSMENQLTYEMFANMMKIYSIRGGVRMDTWLANTVLVREVSQKLILSNSVMNLEGLRESYSLILHVEDTKLLMDYENSSDTGLRLISSKVLKHTGTRLSWIMVAPDMKFDWTLKVDSYGTSNNVPQTFQSLVNAVSLSFKESENFGALSVKIPTPIVRRARNWEGRISETRLKTSLSVPIGNTPYIFQLNVTKVWTGMKTSVEPKNKGWGIEVYGTHWDEAMNQVNPGQQRKHWGEGLRNIWVGTNPDLESRFKEFLQIILEIQSRLEMVDFSHESMQASQ